ncbi:hypothetical protein MMC11_004673 [Xylographa trunciseda]|nr:hypothetical protein [Xylographa trunciseda]
MADSDVRLSPELHHVYALSKRSTGKVLRWIADQCFISDPEKFVWTHSEATAAALVIHQRGIEVPEAIRYAFEDAIRSRKEMAEHYKRNGHPDFEKDRSHKAFIDTLRHLSGIVLSPVSVSTEDHLPKSRPRIATQIVSLNFYDALERLTISETTAQKGYFSSSIAKQIEDIPSTEIPTTTPTKSEVADGPKSRSRDDKVNLAKNACHIILELENICDLIKGYYAEVANGSSNLLLAAWITNIACSHMKCFLASMKGVLQERQRAQTCNGSDFINLTEGTEDQFLEWLESELRTQVFQHGRGLYGALNALRDSRSWKSSDEQWLLEQTLEKPLDRFQPPETISSQAQQESADALNMIAMLRTLKKIDLRREDTTHENGRTAEEMHPLLRMMRVLGEAPTNQLGTDLVFGVQLLLETYKSHLWDGSVKPQKRNCRIQFLRLVSEVKTSFSRVLALRPANPKDYCDCGASECLWTKIDADFESLVERMQQIRAEQRFDLYHQAPWVAGNQMLKILRLGTEYGLMLCNREQNVGTILHIYNLLRQLDLIPEEPILLEKLCVLLDDAVFQGSRPTHSYNSRFVTFMGGRIEFDRSKRRSGRHPEAYNSSEEPIFNGRDRSWRIQMPEYIHKNRLDVHKLCIMQTIDHYGYSPTRDATGAWVKALGIKGTRSETTHLEMLEEFSTRMTKPMVPLIDGMEKIVRKEFEGDFPSALVNWLEVYLTCSEMLEKIAHIQLRESGSEDIPHLDGGQRYCNYGTHFVAMFLDFIDECTATNGGKSDFGLRNGCFRCFKTAFEEALSGESG